MTLYTMGCSHCKIIEEKIAEAKIKCDIVDATKDNYSMKELMETARKYHVKDVPFAVVEGDVMLYDQLLEYVNSEVEKIKNIAKN